MHGMDGEAGRPHQLPLPNRWEPVRFDQLPVKSVRPGYGLGRYQIGSNSKFKFKFKKIKISKSVIPTGKPVKPAGKPVYRFKFKIQI